MDIGRVNSFKWNRPLHTGPAFNASLSLEPISISKKPWLLTSHIHKTFQAYRKDPSLFVYFIYQSTSRKRFTRKAQFNKKLSYRPGTARCVVSVEILPIATQQCRNYLFEKLTRATKSCCRQRLTMYAINYSGRASELGSIDSVDQRRRSLSCSERPPFSS